MKKIATMLRDSIYIKVIFILLSSVLFAACQPNNNASQVEFKVPVIVAKVDVKTVEDIITTSGTVRAAETITLEVMTSGLLQIANGENGRLAEGDHVYAGDLIANITGEDVRLAANMRAAQERIKVAKKNLEVTTILLKKNLVSVSEHGSNKTAFEDAKHEYERSLHSEARNKIITPIDGVILSLARSSGQPMANGQLVSAGQSIAQIAPLDILIVDVDLIGRDIARVKKGLIARATYHAWENRDFEGQLLRLSPTLDERTRALRAEVEIDNREGFLRPGMYIEVSLIAEKRENVPVIPRRALTQRGGLRVVFVAKGNRVEQRKVELGLSDDDFIEVRKGVEVGESVVVQGLETLADQMPIRVTGS